ncbi:MAG TPA: hypothetical protein V6C85_35415 [Allocoleopsis sp.]
MNGVHQYMQRIHIPSDLKVGSRESGMGNTTFIHGYEFFSSRLPSTLCPLPYFQVNR